MTVKLRVFLGVFLLHLVRHTYCGYREQEEELVFLERFSQFHCYKHSICTPGGDRVCGHDKRNTVLAYFNDVCLMHLANCKRAGVYSLIDIIVCDAKYNYTVNFQDELQFEPIVRPTSPPTTPNIIIASHTEVNVNPGKIKGDLSKQYLDNTYVRMQLKKYSKPTLMRLLERRKSEI